MDKKSKIFFSFFFAAVAVVAVISFIKFYILKDYYITSEVACDPARENCFIYECDPTDGSECPEDLNERVSYYKLIEKKASAIPLCDPNEADCPPLVCQVGEDCTETLCDEATKTADEQCSDPQEYLKNKNETENNGCSSGDKNCLVDENVSPNKNGQGKTDNENQVQNNYNADN